MTPEDIARRFERRIGYELVDYAEVALPLYRLTVDAVSMVHREIPPIKEFVMRAVAAEISHLQDISGFLGLDSGTVSAAVEGLKTDKLIQVSDDSESFLLTEQGEDVLAKMRISSPQDEMLVFLYDRLLLRPVRLSAAQLMVPANINPKAMVEIRPYPAEGPDVEQLMLPDVSQVLEEEAGGRASFGRDILRLKRIARRIRLYRPAVALVYKKIRSSEVQIAFIVDDARHEGLEHAFAERGGPKKMGFVRSIDESATAAELRRNLGAEVVELLPDTKSLEEKRIAVSVARLKHQAAVARSERAGDRASDELKDAVEQSLTNLQSAQGDLSKFPARPLAAYEPVELLEQALKSTRRNLFISSRGIDESVVDALFLKRLSGLLEEGVRVAIALSEARPGSVAGEIEKLRQRFSRLTVSTGRKRQFHYVISDDRFAAISNRPFLGNIGKARTFQHIVGYLLQDTQLVNAFLSRIDASAGGDGRQEAT